MWTSPTSRHAATGICSPGKATRRSPVVSPPTSVCIFMTCSTSSSAPCRRMWCTTATTPWPPGTWNTKKPGFAGSCPWITSTYRKAPKPKGSAPTVRSPWTARKSSFQAASRTCTIAATKKSWQDAALGWKRIEWPLRRSRTSEMLSHWGRPVNTIRFLKRFTRVLDKLIIEREDCEKSCKALWPA